MTVGDLIARIGFKLDKKGLKEAETSIAGFSGRGSTMLTKMGTALKGMFSVAAIAAIGRYAKAALSSFNKQQQAIAQVRQGLITTEGVAGKTLKELIADAGRLQETSLFGDEDILGGVTAQLLTFTNIAGTAFDRAQLAALDLATRLGVDLKSATIQLGKALNDPVTNLSALSRSGIQFTEDQKDLINAFVATNEIAKAQTIILNELELQYGGSAAAAAAAGTGPITQLGNSFGDLTETMGLVISLGINPMAAALKDFLGSGAGGGLIQWTNDLSLKMGVVAQLFLNLPVSIDVMGARSRDFADDVKHTSDMQTVFNESLETFGGAAVQFGLDLDSVGPPLTEADEKTTTISTTVTDAVPKWIALRDEVHLMAEALGVELVPVVGEVETVLEDDLDTALIAMVGTLGIADTATDEFAIQLRELAPAAEKAATATGLAIGELAEAFGGTGPGSLRGAIAEDLAGTVIDVFGIDGILPGAVGHFVDTAIRSLIEALAVDLLSLITGPLTGAFMGLFGKGGTGEQTMNSFAASFGVGGAFGGVIIAGMAFVAAKVFEGWNEHWDSFIGGVRGALDEIGKEGLFGDSGGGNPNPIWAGDPGDPTTTLGATVQAGIHAALAAGVPNAAALNAFLARTLAPEAYRLLVNFFGSHQSYMDFLGGFIPGRNTNTNTNANALNTSSMNFLTQAAMQLVSRVPSPGAPAYASAAGVGAGGQTLRLVDHNFSEILTGTLGYY